MELKYPFVYTKAVAIHYAHPRKKLVSQQLLVGLQFKTGSNQFTRVIDVVLDTATTITSLPLAFAKSCGIPLPHLGPDNAITITGATGEGTGWVGPAEIRFPAFRHAAPLRIDCCFNPTLKFPVLGAKDIFENFRLERGEHPVSGESGHFLVPLNEPPLSQTTAAPVIVPREQPRQSERQSGSRRGARPLIATVAVVGIAYLATLGYSSFRSHQRLTEIASRLPKLGAKAPLISGELIENGLPHLTANAALNPGEPNAARVVDVCVNLRNLDLDPLEIQRLELLVFKVAMDDNVAKVLASGRGQKTPHGKQDILPAGGFLPPDQKTADTAETTQIALLDPDSLMAGKANLVYQRMFDSHPELRQSIGYDQIRSVHFHFLLKDAAKSETMIFKVIAHPASGQVWEQQHWTGQLPCGLLRRQLPSRLVP